MKIRVTYIRHCACQELIASVHKRVTHTFIDKFEPNSAPVNLTRKIQLELQASIRFIFLFYVSPHLLLSSNHGQRDNPQCVCNPTCRPE